MNVLDATRTPRVMNLKEVIQSYLDHLREVLLRRSKQRLEKINYTARGLRWLYEGVP